MTLESKTYKAIHDSQTLLQEITS